MRILALLLRVLALLETLQLLPLSIYSRHIIVVPHHWLKNRFACI
jgi:hypothetical protein